MILRESQEKKVIGLKDKTVAVTGHRVLEKNFNYNNLSKVLYDLSDKYDTFLIGMALGFDTECFKALINIRKEKNIKIVACIPCADQSSKFSALQKRVYEKLVNSADQVIVLKDKYDLACMHIRNRFMVDNASLLLAYMCKNKGGTAYTVNYANEKNVPVMRI